MVGGWTVGGQTQGWGIVGIKQGGGCTVGGVQICTGWLTGNDGLHEQGAGEGEGQVVVVEQVPEEQVPEVQVGVSQAKVEAMSEPRRIAKIIFFIKNYNRCGKSSNL